MPRLSVVVPIYNVEEFLEPCLDSIAGQTFSDLEVVLVNDGATDNSRAIAAAYTERDPRFKLVDRPNGGLSAARNTGIEHATGEYLAFVDSDDLLPPNAYELLVGSLESTGSDIASGNVMRLTAAGTWQARFLAKTFQRNRPKTHITRYRELLLDRVAWNKVFRRSFWDEHGLRFPEGRTYEDIPVILPLHFSARSVDVLADTVYYWRFRELGERSITERRLDRDALVNRVRAVSDVHDFLASHGAAKARRWYDETIVEQDLMYHLNVLDRADDGYRELFLDRVNALLDRADKAVFDPLRAIDRLKWHLVRRRLVPELLEVLRFEKRELRDRPFIRQGRHWYGDYPFRGDPRLDVPDSVYRLDRELTVAARIDGLGVDAGRLRIDGWIYIDGVGAAEPGAQTVDLRLLPTGRFQRLRYVLGAARLKAEPVHRPDATTESAQRLCDVSWSGFTATLDPRRLRRFGRWKESRWELYATVRAAGERRLRMRFAFTPRRPVAAVDLPSPDGVLVRAVPAQRGELVVDVRTEWAALTGLGIEGDELVLRGELHGRALKELELRAADGRERERVAVACGANAFSARLPVARAATAQAWRVPLRGAGASVRRDGVEYALTATQQGDAVLTVGPPRALVSDASWSDDGALSVLGEGVEELVLYSRRHFAVRPLEAATIRPGAIETLGGALPLPEGDWELGTLVGGEFISARLGAELGARLPLGARVGHKHFTLGPAEGGGVQLAATRDLDDDERGGYHQRLLRTADYSAHRAEPLTDAVVYMSFGGRQCSDSPRAIHAELVRRAAPLEHLWAIRDGAATAPDGARAVRYGSREHYEALARARFVVANDHFPDFFERREDQTCVQTWHGTPLKRIGFDVSELRGASRKLERLWEQQVGNWQHVISPSAFATPILQHAFQLEGELIETGYPRDDVLADAGRARAVRERLGIADGVRVVLYAPTLRDHAADRGGTYLLDWQLDIARLHAALGDDTVLLVRRHPYVEQELPPAANGFARDVSAYPDATELLLAADALITDYSSIMADFACTGRPMLFFAYDLDSFREQVRGFYIDYEATVPGPVLRTSEELADALAGLDALQAVHADRYAAFRSRFCEHADGGAAARVVDRVFGEQWARA
jgi:CDP-glycerol glycerophosphotransferase